MPDKGTITHLIQCINDIDPDHIKVNHTAPINNRAHITFSYEKEHKGFMRYKTFHLDIQGLTHDQAMANADLEIQRFINSI